jgi:hypothetical protein
MSLRDVVGAEELFTQRHYYYHLPLPRSLVRSVRYSALTKSSFYLNVSLTHAVGEKKTPTAA